jgi:hypothetical protein
VQNQNSGLETWPNIQEADTVTYRNPAPTVDIIIELIDQPHWPIVLIERLTLL